MKAARESPRAADNEPLEGNPMSETDVTATISENAPATVGDVRRVIKEELASATSIPDLMHAVRALCPVANVAVELRGAEGYASVTVSGLPESTFGEHESGGEYPNTHFAIRGYLSVSRDRDGDMIAALRTALDLVTERMTAVPA